MPVGIAEIDDIEFCVDRPFFQNPTLNSPYECPSRHWEPGKCGIPTGLVVAGRLDLTLITPIPKPKTRKAKQDLLKFDQTAAVIETETRQDEVAQTISEISPFFCQVEAVETVIWPTGIAPQSGKHDRHHLNQREYVNWKSNANSSRLALRLGTGTGKTTIMASLIAWQAINFVRGPNSRRFTLGFLVVTLRVTVRDRLRVLHPDASVRLLIHDVRRCYRTKPKDDHDGKLVDDDRNEAQPIVTPSSPPRKTVHVRAISPDRDKSEIVFPRVAGYRVEFPRKALRAKFTSDSTLVLDPQDLDPSETINERIIGRDVNINIGHEEAKHKSAFLFYLTSHLLSNTWCDDLGRRKHDMFEQLKGIASEWLENYLVCPTGTSIVHLFSTRILAKACERINSGIVAEDANDRRIAAMLDPDSLTGSTRSVNFVTAKNTLWKTDSNLCHVNWAVCDSEREVEFCRMVEKHPLTRAYVKNQGLGLEIPYRHGSVNRRYSPDFIVRLDTDDQQPPTYVIVETEGYRRENAKDKKLTVEEYWLPSINRLRIYGHWDFVELRDIDTLEDDYTARLQQLTGWEPHRRYTPAQVAAAKRLIAWGGSNPDIEQIPRRRSNL